MPRLGLGEHRPDEPLEQIDRLIGQSSAELKGDRNQGSREQMSRPLLSKGTKPKADHSSQGRKTDHRTGFSARRSSLAQ
jgi:hypothetical protein